ncbi:uncharacterized protein LOC108927859 [Scleropages formosus]|uniref:uncharacterized protein LOC108927859 n=1 Tax=Scleropages formosus TaxID=113540 RepID=UPI000878F29E|nr:uncharacterized protein LOC108927859 [Scleropages formosus]
MQLLLSLLCCIPVMGVFSTVSQFPPSVEVMEGASITLECRFDLVIQYCYTVNWMKLQLNTNVLTTYQNKNMDGSKPSQFKCLLSINRATVSDSGVYYCSVVRGNMVYLGNGSSVTVIGNTTKTPSIEVLMAFESSLQSPVLLLCLVSGLSSSQVHVSWDIGGTAANGSSKYSWRNNPLEMLWTQNLVLVSAEEWHRGSLCTCVVEYEGQRFLKSVQSQGSGVPCLTLTYVASGGAALVLVVALSVLICLSCGCPKVFKVKKRMGAECKNQSSGRLGRGSQTAAIYDTMEIHYATLDVVSLGRRKKTLMEL